MAQIIKAFSVFGNTNNVEQESEQTENEEDECVFQDVTAELTRAEESLSYHLPPHQRCAAHSLNLISTVDAEKSEDPAYKRLSRSTFSKCQALWNKSSRSDQAAEIIAEECQSLVLLRPNVTRWNSVFLAIERLNQIIKEKGENVIHKLSAEFEIPK